MVTVCSLDKTNMPQSVLKIECRLNTDMFRKIFLLKNLKCYYIPQYSFITSFEMNFLEISFPKSSL